MTDRETTSRNLAASIYNGLKTDILSGRLMPGKKLVISDLSATHGVSPGAVREALSRLTSEELVVAEPMRGFRVVPSSVSELEDLTQVRIFIEQHCLERAMCEGDLKWESEIVSALYQINRTDFRSADDPKIINDAWSDAHHRFHASLVSACDSVWMLKLREQLFVQSRRYHHLSVLLPADDRDIRTEHSDLAEAVIARDLEKAKELIAAHFEKTKQILKNSALIGTGQGNVPG
ncbi:MAG: GntR family transcriptional regulator [Hyphomicrobiales bacterium]|nr:MAG: GntR family transcriptional regulator [Hyphomicrobiales bacterium]